MDQSTHWTAGSTEAFIHRIIFDFIAQLEKRMDALPATQAELAKKLRVSKGAVSQILNNSRNLNLKTAVKYAQALGMKAALIAYDDDDPDNQHGPVGSEIFTACWEKLGKPFDLLAMQSEIKMASTRVTIPFSPGICDWQATLSSWADITVGDNIFAYKVSAPKQVARTADMPAGFLQNLTIRSIAHARIENLHI